MDENAKPAEPTPPKPKPRSITGAVAAAAVCAGLEAGFGFGTFTMFIAAVLAFMMSRRSPEITYGRVLVAGMLVGVAAGVLDGSTDLLGQLLERNFGYMLTDAPPDAYDYPRNEEAFARTLVMCCAPALVQPFFGMAGAWFGRAVGPSSPADG
jgi:hypothetical protein